MEIADIIRKEELETEEMIFVVESYIKEKKGQDVNIKINDSFGQFGILRELHLLNHAYNNTCAYYFEKERNGQNYL